MKEHIIINKDRTVVVPDSVRKIGIQYDHKVNTLTFDCPRYADDNQSIDMSRMTIYINFSRNDKTKGSVAATNIFVDPDNPEIMHFDVVITRSVTLVNGPIICLVCAKSTDAEGVEVSHWNSELFNKLSVGEGLEAEELTEEEIDYITSLLQEINTTRAEVADMDTRVEDLEFNQEKQGAVSEVDLEAMTWTEGSYVTGSGTIESSSGYGISELVTLPKMSTLILDATGYQSNVAMIAKSDHTPLVTSVDGKTHYEYYTDEEIQVYISCKTTVAKSAKIVRNVSETLSDLERENGELKGDIGKLSKEMIDVKGATVGQIIKVSAVDDTGKPTAWEPATPPSKLTDFKNDLYFSKEELFLTLTKNDFEYDEEEGWALYVSNPNTTFTEDGNGFAYKVNVSIGGKTYTNSGTYSDFKMKDSDPPSISEFFSTDDQSDFIETHISMSGGYNAKTDDENYSGFSIIIDDYDVTWLDVDDFTLELYRIKYKKISIDTIDFGDFFDRLTYSELDAVDERINEESAGGHTLFPLIYFSGRGFYAAMERYSTKGMDKTNQIHQYSIDPNVVGYKFSLNVGQTYTSPTTNNMRIYEAGNPIEMSSADIFAMSKSSGSGNIMFDATINGTKVRSVPCQSLYNAYGSTDFKAYSMLADGDKLYSICAERVGTSGTISVKRLM